MRKPKRKTKPNKIITSLQQAIKMAASRVPVAPCFNPGQILCVGGRAIVSDANGQAWLLDCDSGSARLIASWQVKQS